MRSCRLIFHLHNGMCSNTFILTKKNSLFRDLANKAEVRVPTMTETVKHLLDEKILEAETDAQDKRKKYYHLTPSGEQLFEKANDIGLTVQNDLLQDCTEEEIDTTIKVLNSISKRLTHY